MGREREVKRRGSDCIEEILESYPDDFYKPLWKLRLEKDMELDSLRIKPDGELEKKLAAEIEKVDTEVRVILSNSGINKLFRNNVLEPEVYGGLPFSTYHYEASDATKSLWLATRRGSIIEFQRSKIFGITSLTIKQDFAHQARIPFSERKYGRRILDLHSEWAYPVGALAPHIGPNIVIVDRTGPDGNIEIEPRCYINEDALPKLDDFLSDIRRDLTPKRRPHRY